MLEPMRNYEMNEEQARKIWETYQQKATKLPPMPHEHTIKSFAEATGISRRVAERFLEDETAKGNLVMRRGPNRLRIFSPVDE